MRTRKNNLAAWLLGVSFCLATPPTQAAAPAEDEGSSNEEASGPVNWTWDPARVVNPTKKAAKKSEYDLEADQLKDIWTQFRDQELTEWNQELALIQEKWSDGATSTAKTYVGYAHEHSARVRVDYEAGNVHVEALIPHQREPRSGELVTDVRTLLDNALSPSAGLAAPLNVDDFPGRFDLQEIAARMSREGTTTGTDGVTRSVYRMSMKLVPDHMVRRAERYLPLIRSWSRKNNLDPALVLGVVRQESAFNPRARSGIPAFGLMQIVPDSAGREVLTGRGRGKPIRVPEPDFLYRPENNVMIGTKYLAILRDRYFSEISDPIKRLYLMIAAYNWGPTRVRTAIRRKRVNLDVGSELLFQKLQEITPEETRTYLKQVLRYKDEFAELPQVQPFLVNAAVPAAAPSPGASPRPGASPMPGGSPVPSVSPSPSLGAVPVPVVSPSPEASPAMPVSEKTP